MEMLIPPRISTMPSVRASPPEIDCSDSHARTFEKTRQRKQENQRKGAKAQRREGAKVVAELHRVRARQPRTPSALGTRKTVSISKLVFDSGTMFFPSDSPDECQLMSPVFPLPHHASRTARLSSTLTPAQANKASFEGSAERNPFASLHLGDFAFLSFWFRLRWVGYPPEAAEPWHDRSGVKMCELFAMSSSHPATVNLSLGEFSRHGGLMADLVRRNRHPFGPVV